MIVALIKIIANDPFEDSLELVIVDRKSFCLIHSRNFSKINFKQKIKVMSLNKIWNSIRQDTVKKFISIDQLLRLTNAIWTVLGANRQKVDHSQVHIKQLFFSQVIIVHLILMFSGLIKSFDERRDDSELGRSEFRLHVDQTSESRVLSDLFHDVLLIAAFIVFVSFDFVVFFIHVGLFVS